MTPLALNRPSIHYLYSLLLLLRLSVRNIPNMTSVISNVGKSL